MMKAFLLATVCAALCGGCMSVVARVNGCWGEPYIGTQCALGYSGNVPALWVDLPFEVILDTVCLPADLICHPFTHQPSTLQPSTFNQTKENEQ